MFINCYRCREEIDLDEAYYKVCYKCGFDHELLKPAIFEKVKDGTYICNEDQAKIRLGNVFLRAMENTHNGRYHITLTIESWDDFSKLLPHLGKTVSIEILLLYYKRG